MNRAIPTTFPSRLRSEREAAGYTQQELAALCGRSKQWVTQMESDAYRYRPTRTTVALLAGMLGCALSDLDPSYEDEIPAGAVVLRPDPDASGVYRPWREQDRKEVGGESVDHTELPALATLLRGHGLGLYLLP